MLPIKAGTTLRSYLSEKLHCDPMRITKKFAGAACIGKQVFIPCPLHMNHHSMAQCSDELAHMEGAFLRLAATEMGPYVTLLNSKHNTNTPSVMPSVSSSRKRRHTGTSARRNDMTDARDGPDSGGKYQLYEANLFAASDLLLQFSKKMKDDCVSESANSGSSDNGSSDNGDDETNFDSDFDSGSICGGGAADGVMKLGNNECKVKKERFTGTESDFVFATFDAEARASFIAPNLFITGEESRGSDLSRTSSIG